MQEKERILVKNTGILAIGTLCSKVLTFFLLPLYTAVLSTEDYGIVDVLQTVGSLLLPFITLQLGSGLFRFMIDQKRDEERIVLTTTAMTIEILNIILFVAVISIVNFLRPIPYFALFVVYVVLTILFDAVQNVTRGLGHNAVYSIMSFIMTAVSLLANLILILGLGFKGDSILIASSVAYLIAIAFGFASQKMWKFIRFSAFSIVELRRMLKYCIPLIPNSISWWIANTSDRLIVLFFIGVDANGIYAAANKIPVIYTTIFNVYNLAWIEALSRNVSENGQEDFINSIFSKSLKFFGCITVGMICSISLFFDMIIGSSYSEAYIHVLILMIAIFVNSLCSLFGGILTAYKKTDIIAKTTIYGALSNFVINIIFVNVIGLYAASISTLLSYLIIFGVRYKCCKEYIAIKWPLKYVAEFLACGTTVSICYVMKNYLLNIALLTVVAIWSVYENKELILGILNSIKRKLIKQ